jgi:hypothetical protein
LSPVIVSTANGEPALHLASAPFIRSTRSPSFGTAKAFTREAASGGEVHTYFCPNCGSTIYWKADNLPSLIGVAVGALADPKYPAPIKSVFEQSKHDWVQIGGAVEHFQQSSVARNPG